MRLEMTDMNLGMTERLKPIHAKVAQMVRDEIIPLDEEFLADVGKAGDKIEDKAEECKDGKC